MDFVAIDVETSNSDPSSICQIGGVIFKDGVEIDSFCWLVNPWQHFAPINVSIHGICAEQVENEETFDTLHADLHEKTVGSVVLCHGSFDRSALGKACDRAQKPTFDCAWIDGVQLGRRAWPGSPGGHGLKALAKRLGVKFLHHDALEDARTAGLVAIAAMRELDMRPEELASGATSIYRKEPIVARKVEIVLDSAASAGSRTAPPYTHDLIERIARALSRWDGDPATVRPEGEPAWHSHRKRAAFIAKAIQA